VVIWIGCAVVVLLVTTVELADPVMFAPSMSASMPITQLPTCWYHQRQIKHPRSELNLRLCECDEVVRVKRAHSTAKAKRITAPAEAALDADIETRPVRVCNPRWRGFHLQISRQSSIDGQKRRERGASEQQPPHEGSPRLSVAHSFRITVPTKSAVGGCHQGTQSPRMVNWELPLALPPHARPPSRQCRMIFSFFQLWIMAE
jgi:hypothetical protein